MTTPPSRDQPSREATGQGQPGREQPEQSQPVDDAEALAPGLARERTSLAWTRTALSFGALGGTVLKANVPTGLIILALAPVIWRLGQVTRGATHDGLPAVGPAKLFAIALTIVAVSVLCLAIAIFGRSVPGALR